MEWQHSSEYSVLYVSTGVNGQGRFNNTQTLSLSLYIYIYIYIYMVLFGPVKPELGVIPSG